MSAVLSSSSDRIGVITLNRPEARNAVDREMALGLEAAVDRLEEDPDVWVGVLCAKTAEQARPVFCAGADLKVIRETGSADVLDTERGGFGGFVYRERTKPIVVAVDGLATARWSGDRPRRRHRRGDHPIGVRTGRGAAQPHRRGRRALPPPARGRARGGDGRHPHR